MALPGRLIERRVTARKGHPTVSWSTCSFAALGLFLRLYSRAGLGRVGDALGRIRRSRSPAVHNFATRADDYLGTIDAGLNHIDRVFNEMRRDNRVTVDGAVAAELYQTYGVPPELFARVGAVSEEVALAMARGALERGPADIAVAVTGIAGPTGGSEAKPVGLVYIGINAVCC